MENLGEMVQAKPKRHLPCVLTVEEVDHVLAEPHGGGRMIHCISSLAMSNVNTSHGLANWRIRPVTNTGIASTHSMGSGKKVA